MSGPLFPFVLSLSKGVNETGRLPPILFDRLTMSGKLTWFAMSGLLFPFVLVSSTGQALSLSKGVKETGRLPAHMVRQAHHERARGLVYHERGRARLIISWLPPNPR